MPIFQFIPADSGSPVLYGGSTIGVPNPRLVVHYSAPDDRVIRFIEASGSPPAYFNVLNSRFLNRPSGWSH